MAQPRQAAAGPTPLTGPAGGLRVDRPARLAEAVVGPMIRWIVDGHIAAGNELPPEPRLAEEFGVSRTVIREALQELEKKGLTRTRHGKKAIALGIEEWDLLDPDILAALLESARALRILADLLEVRTALEVELIATATRRLTTADLSALEELLAAMERVKAHPDEYGRLEHQFHSRLIEPSGNSVALGILRPVVKQLHLGGKRWADQVAGATDLDTAHAEHVQILRLVTKRNAAGAAKALRQHIQTSWAWVEHALATDQPN